MKLYNTNSHVSTQAKNCYVQFIAFYMRKKKVLGVW
jgi:hypothetical protein